MKQFIPRWIQGKLQQALQVMPVVVLTGARQTGKSTLARQVQPGRRYLTLDDLDVLEQARRDPDALLANPPLTLDEIQRAPELLSAIKRRVDAERRPGDYLLTGSAQFALMRHVAESLAGRAVYLDLCPFCPLEWKRADPALALVDSLLAEDLAPALWQRRADAGNWGEWLLRGGFAPAIEIHDAKARSVWFGGYVQTYLERDLRDLSDVSSLPDFQRVMRIVAQRTGRLSNQAEMARDAALAHATCHRYLNLMETGFQIVRLPAFSSNPTTALVKSPKVFWGDAGLAAWLAGIRDLPTLRQRADLGFWLEQAVFQTLHAWRSMDPVRRRISHWRTRGGEEVDFVVEEDQRCAAIEVKAASRVGLDDTRGLNRFLLSRPPGIGPARGVILYGGADVRVLTAQVVARPYAALFPALGDAPP